MRDEDHFDWNMATVREMNRPDELQNLKFRVVFRLLNTTRRQSIWLPPSDLDDEGVKMCKEGHLNSGYILNS